VKPATKYDHRQRQRADFEQTRKGLGLNRIDFPEWLPQVTPQWSWGWKHQLMLYRKLQDVTDGITKRLMIFMPPRHSK